MRVPDFSGLIRLRGGVVDVLLVLLGHPGHRMTCATAEFAGSGRASPITCAALAPRRPRSLRTGPHQVMAATHVMVSGLIQINEPPVPLSQYVIMRSRYTADTARSRDGGWHARAPSGCLFAGVTADAREVLSAVRAPKRDDGKTGRRVRGWPLDCMNRAAGSKA